MKNNIYFINQIAVLLIVFTFASCKNNNEVEGKAPRGFGNISYVVKTTSDDAKKVMSISSDTVARPFVDWTYATVYVEKIIFTGKTESWIDTTIVIEKKINIFNRDALVGIIKLPSGSYKDVNVKMICRKSQKSDFAFDFQGTFYTARGRDSIIIGSSFPFEVALSLNNLIIDQAKSYEATFNFDLHKIFTGITSDMIQRDVRSSYTLDNIRKFVIWKGGSQDEPFYDQMIQNWEKVVSISVKEIDSNVIRD